MACYAEFDTESLRTELEHLALDSSTKQRAARPPQPCCHLLTNSNQATAGKVGAKYFKSIMRFAPAATTTNRGA